MKKSAAYYRLKSLQKAASFVRVMRKYGASYTDRPSIYDAPEMKPDYDPWGIPEVPTNGFLDIPDDVEIPSVIADRGYRPHYNIAGSNDIYALGAMSKQHNGWPITFTDQYGGHPGYVQYIKPGTPGAGVNGGKTRFVYGPMTDEKNETNDLLMKALYQFNGDLQTDAANTYWKYREDPTVPASWLAGASKIEEQYMKARNEASRLETQGKYTEAAKILQGAAPAYLMDLHNYLRPEMVPYEYIHNPEPEVQEEQWTRSHVKPIKPKDLRKPKAKKVKPKVPKAPGSQSTKVQPANTANVISLPEP